MADTGEGIGSVAAIQQFDAEIQGVVADAVSNLRSRVDLAFDLAEGRFLEFNQAATAIVDELVDEAGDAVKLIKIAKEEIEGRFDQFGSSEHQYHAQISQSDTQSASNLKAVKTYFLAAAGVETQLDGELSSQSTKLATSVQSQTQALTQAKNASDSQVSDVGMALDEFGVAAGDHANRITESLTELSDMLSKSLDDTVKALQELAGTTSDNISAEIKTAIDELGSKGQDAIGELDALMEKASGLGDMFGGEVKEVMEIVQEVVELIETIRPILELAKKLS